MKHNDKKKFNILHFDFSKLDFPDFGDIDIGNFEELDLGIDFESIEIETKGNYKDVN